MAYMASGFHVDLSEFHRALRDLNFRTDRSSVENLVRYARSTVSNRQGTGLLEITPPASSKMIGMAARRQGEAAIDRDLSAIFIPIRLKHKRRERWPDVEGIHSTRFSSSSRFNHHLTRGQRSPYYVDINKLRALRRRLFMNVGKMASGWVAIADALGVHVPAWIARHGAARGESKLEMVGPHKRITMANLVSKGAPADELNRRLQYAIDRATDRMDRDFSEDFVKNGRASGFKVL